MTTTLSTEIVTGAVTLRERPQALLADREAYRLPESPTRAEWITFSAWVVARGGEVPYFDEHGLLLRSVYLNEHGGDSGERYHEWLTGSDLIVHNAADGEFSAYGCGMTDHYVVENADSYPPDSSALGGDDD